MMTLSRLLLRSLRFHWRASLVVCIGVAIATAVITGSLVIGESVNASLRRIVLSRIGEIDYVIAAHGFFRDGLADDIADEEGLPAASVVPLITLPGAARNAETGETIPSVNISGVDEDFWRLYGLELSLTGRSAALNASLARELGLSAGDALLVTVRRDGNTPGGVLFGRRDRHHTQRTMRVNVAHVLPDEGAGSFSLRHESLNPSNVFISKEWLADMINRPAHSNAILVNKGNYPVNLRAALERRATPGDIGVQVVQNPQLNYLSVENRRLVFADELVQRVISAAREMEADAWPVSVHLAKKITRNDGRSISYAIIAGIDHPSLLPAVPGVEAIDADDVLLNRWAAQALDAQVGDILELSYYMVPRDGTYRTTERRFVLRGIVEMNGLGADPGLVPDFEGITEAEAIGDWDPPFPVDLDLVTDADEQYWRDYRAAPKAFVSLDVMREIWEESSTSGTGGWITSLRVAVPDGQSIEDFAAGFEELLQESLRPDDGGMVVEPVRQRAVGAAKGSQDYTTLFLSMSGFIMIAALALSAMMMRLAVQRRASEIGMLLACGFTRRKARLLTAAEGLIVAAAGAAAGVPLAVAYAGLIVRGLAGGQFGSIGRVSLWLHVDTAILLSGAAAGAVAGAAAIWFGTRSLGSTDVLQLLAGWQQMNITLKPARVAFANWIAALCVAGAAAVISVSVFTDAIGTTTTFFVSGALLPVAALAGAYSGLAGILRHHHTRLTPLKLALRSAAANRGRSLLTAGLFAAASFVIVAVAANVRDFAAADPTDRESGTGGFTLMAVSAIPIHYDFSTSNGREQLGFHPEDEHLFDDVRVYPLLLSSGDDASCLNIAATEAPRVAGAGPDMIERGGFRVRLEKDVAQAIDVDSPWTALYHNYEDGTIPVIGDADSVIWQLHSGLGRIITTIAGDGSEARLRVTGLVSGSILAGELVMSQENFRRLFPDDSAPRYFLIETPPDRQDAVAAALRRSLGELGLDVHSTRETLNALTEVQNTYMSTFLALGGLGIVLGTFGMVVVLLRNALERRGEFALMIAGGFGSFFPARLLVLENILLLFLGLAAGAVSAVVAVAPVLVARESNLNWPLLAGILAGIMLTGLVSCVLAARSVVGGSLVQALREE